MMAHNVLGSTLNPGNIETMIKIRLSLQRAHIIFQTQRIIGLEWY